MKTRLILLAAGVGAMLAGTAAAAADDAAKQSKPEKQVCRRIQHVGTRLGTTVCMTRAEWAKSETEGNEKARRTIRDAEERNDHYINPIQPSGG